MLVASGLYQKEAQAMVATWRDSWFEEGVRVFYLVPATTVDALLPLTITPAPAGVARAFVGRMDVITPATIATVRDAIAEADDGALAAYGRFLGPIADRILSKASDAERAAEAVLGAAYKSYVSQPASYCQ